LPACRRLGYGAGLFERWITAADSNPALARIEAGVLRGFPDSIRGQAAFERAWDRIRAVRIHAEPQELPIGQLVNHVVGLNLGPDATLATNFDDAGWRTDRTAHHTVAVFPALVPYAVRAPDPGDCFFVEVAPDFVAGLVGPGGVEPEPLVPMIGVDDAVARHVLLAIAEEARLGAPASALRVEQLAGVLVSRLLDRGLAEREVADRDARPRAAQAAALPSPQLRRVLEYVAAHLDGPLTLQRLGGVADMDVFRFIRAFKQATGLSPHRYILEARIARAKELLRNRALSVTDVALQTGFATPSHFSVTFRRLANVTPREFRNGLP
jgi:AraC family transcriptional regulator